MKKICVVGSTNADLSIRVADFPRPGETINGYGFGTFPGGKGANQAVAVGKLGAKVTMLTVVGEDVFGGSMTENFAACGVETGHIEICPHESTGVALIQVSDSGQNTIVINAGANSKIDREYVSRHLDAIDSSDIVLLQLEIPMETVGFVAEYARGRGKTVILDPAPATDIPAEILPFVDYITPNQTELEVLTGMTVKTVEDVRAAGEALLKKGVGCVINKAGESGAYLLEAGEELRRYPAYEVAVVDTTAAGDSFNAGFAVGLSMGYEVSEAIDLANLVASISTTKFGAQSAMPSMAECDSYRARHGYK